MEVIVPIIVLFFILSAFWFLITGIIVVITGRDISIMDLVVRIRSAGRFTRTKEDIEACLLRSFRYYNNLPPELKPRFLKRVSRFLESKEFRVAGDMELKPEHRILIAASAVQLTFGLDKYLLDHFNQIILYPKAYFSRQQQRVHKGEVNLRGAIILSMEDFFFGYENETDGLNLGLHEMSHALQLEVMVQGDYEAFFGHYFVKWQQEAELEFAKMKETDNPVLRDYATTNLAEFFAVCVENFFERPGDFKRMMPELYQRMTLLLNQDPGDQTGFILSPRMKIRDELYIRFDPGIALYKTEYPWKDVLQEAGLGLLICILPAVAARDSEILAFMLCISVLVFFVRVAPLNRFYLCEQALIVKPIFRFWSSGKVFSYKRIVLLVKTDENPGHLEVTCLSDGSLVHKRYRWSTEAEDPAPFFALLHEKNVLIKSKLG